MKTSTVFFTLLFISINGFLFTIFIQGTTFLYSLINVVSFDIIIYFTMRKIRKIEIKEWKEKIDERKKIRQMINESKLHKD